MRAKNAWGGSHVHPTLSSSLEEELPAVPYYPKTSMYLNREYLGLKCFLSRDFGPKYIIRYMEG